MSSDSAHPLPATLFGPKVRLRCRIAGAIAHGSGASGGVVWRIPRM